MSRELDYEAAKILGWKFDPTYVRPWSKPHSGGAFERCHESEVPRFHENIADAWKLVEAFQKPRWRFDVFSRNGHYWAEIEEGDEFVVGTVDVEAQAKTAPLAITLAALKAQGVDVSKWEGK